MEAIFSEVGEIQPLGLNLKPLIIDLIIIKWALNSTPSGWMVPQTVGGYHGIVCKKGSDMKSCMA